MGDSRSSASLELQLKPAPSSAEQPRVSARRTQRDFIPQTQTQTQCSCLL